MPRVNKESRYEYQRDWARRHPRKRSEASNRAAKRYREKNRKACQIRSGLWMSKNLHRRRGYKLSGKYGLSVSDYETLLEAQGNVCALCHKPFGKTRAQSPVIDHDHKTQYVRGILHSQCNLGIGQLGDTLEAVQLALDYLKSRTV